MALINAMHLFTLGVICATAVVGSSRRSQSVSLEYPPSYSIRNKFDHASHVDFADGDEVFFNAQVKGDRNRVQLVSARLDGKPGAAKVKVLTDRKVSRNSPSALKGWIDEAGQVLDIGCGTGVAARRICARDGFRGTCHGIDLSEYLTDAASRLAEA